MDEKQKILPTPDMIRAARGYLDWSQHELGLKCNLSKVSLVGIESGKQHPNHETLKRIASVFWNEGIVFLSDGGFRVDRKLVKVLEGKEGFKFFFDDVYKTATEKDEEFFVSGVDESKFDTILKEIDSNYEQKMISLLRGKSKFKVLIGEKDKNDSRADYAAYKSLPQDFINSNVPFYVYGNKLAIILWNQEKIVLHFDEDLVNAYKSQFNLLWKIAK
ncbi:MAG: helix-turn-helix transcriptional regulator [Alphaproteobacteria bacterium]|nr:helix-turn-helix transcriptional regulator [Alphaproteobacteria bacterium]